MPRFKLLIEIVADVEASSEREALYKVQDASTWSNMLEALENWDLHNVMTYEQHEGRPKIDCASCGEET
jgi:hypothetical protein